MTKYILHGGAAKRDTANNKRFFAEITDGLTEPINLLIVCFAKDQNVWDEVFEKMKLTFSAASPKKQIKFTLAKEDTKMFIEQIKTADAIYMLGGKSVVLRNYLARVNGIENLLDGKVVAGSSAGALVLTKHWYENDDGTYNDGLGILNFKLFCHYSADSADKLKKLIKYGVDIEIKTLEEEKFIVINK